MAPRNPTSGVPRMARNQAADPHLRLFGLIERELILTPADLIGLPRVQFTGGMTCNQAGRRPGACWTGVPIGAITAMARPTQEIRYLNVSAGPYAVAIPLERAAGVMLADRLDDAPIEVEAGGPWRLIIPEGALYNSVKWVDAIEFGATPHDSAERIAAARARATAKQTTPSHSSDEQS